MIRFPKFLKANPEIWGMGHHELIALILGLYGCIFLGLDSLVSFLVCGLFVCAMCNVRRKYDLKVFFVSNLKYLKIRVENRSQE